MVGTPSMFRPAARRERGPCDVLIGRSVSSSKSIRDSSSTSSSLSLASSRVGAGVGFDGGTLAAAFFRGTALGANREVDLMTEAETGVWGCDIFLNQKRVTRSYQWRRSNM